METKLKSEIEEYSKVLSKKDKAKNTIMNEYTTNLAKKEDLNTQLTEVKD